MKCIYLWQPFATLWVLGEKLNETRSYATKHRGELVVGAAKLTKVNQKIGEDLYNTEIFYDALAKHGYKNWKDLPTGALVGITELTGCKWVDDTIEDNIVKFSDGTSGYFSPQERDFGNWSIGRCIWMADNHRPIKPIPYKGQQGMFNIEDKIIKNSL